MLKITQITIDGRINPVGLSTDKPQFCWKIESDTDNTFQKSYQIKVLQNGSICWDSGVVESEESLYIKYNGASLKAHTEYTVELTVDDFNGNSAFAVSKFFTGKLFERWSGKWIGSERINSKDNSLPVELFENNFSVEKMPKRAVLYASAMGIYKSELNGSKIGDIFFAPGYTHYQKYFQFQTYDVTDMLSLGNNSLSFYVANGWYMGTIGSKNNYYGNRRGIIAELHLIYDEQEIIIGTNDDWRSTVDTPFIYADFYNGQIIDNTKSDRAKWNWEKCTEIQNVSQSLVPHFGAYVKKDCVLKCIRKGSILDFGQNHAGVIHLTVKAKKGTVIKIRHGEILNNDGSLFTANLRSAKQELVLTCDEGINDFLPEFTFMGFRYAEITANGPFEIINVESIAITSDTEPIGSFSCSNELLTKLYSNIQWGQRSNFVEIPTDCPQRDERLGWTGDIAVFAKTAAFNRNISAFMKKWLYDMSLEQNKNGSIPMTIPYLGIYEPTPIKTPIAIWGDSATMVPWAVYEAYGDKDFLEKMYPVMKRYTQSEIKVASAFGIGKSKYLWNHNVFQYGDWCAPNESVMKWMRKGKYLATPYFANSVDIMRRSAEALGKTEDAKYYSELHSEIQNAFSSTYIKKDGKLKGDFQSNYVCSLYYDLISKDERAAVAKRLVQLVREKDYCVMTGFAGTPYSAFVLADNGYVEDAYKLLLNTKCPGWLYTVKAGGTTIWERWEALDENGHMKVLNGKSQADMVSFNHYALGAVGNFLQRRTLGIETIKAGYKAFAVKPVIDKSSLSFAQGSIDTMYGKISVSWKIENGEFTVNVFVPANTKCTLTLPNGESYDFGSGNYCRTVKIQ